MKEVSFNEYCNPSGYAATQKRRTRAIPGARIPQDLFLHYQTLISLNTYKPNWIMSEGCDHRTNLNICREPCMISQRGCGICEMQPKTLNWKFGFATFYYWYSSSWYIGILAMHWIESKPDIPIAILRFLKLLKETFASITKLDD